MRAALSASNLAAAALCPGKPRMEAGFIDADSGESKRGTSLHPYFRTGIPRDTLAPADRELLDRAERDAEGFIETFRQRAGIQFGEWATEEHECDWTGIVPGHPDNVLLWRAGRLVVILDLKTGLLQAEEAPSNLQLRSYAALAWQRYGFELCGVAIVQPDAIGARMTTALYTAESMPQVQDELAAIVRATEAPGAPLNAGDEQCRWCKAKTVCPAYNAPLRTLATTETRAVATLPNNDLETLHEIIRRAEALKKEVTPELRRRIREGEMPGWELGNTGSTKKITDLSAAYRRLRAEFPDEPDLADRIMRCLKAVWSDLSGLAVELTGLPQKKARAKLEEMLGGLIEETAKEPTPKRL